MSRLRLPNLPVFFSGKPSQRDIARIVDRLNISPSGNLDTISPEAVGVAVVQLLFKRYISLEDYIVDMNLYISDAVNRRAQMIVFPALTGLLPFSVHPQYENAIAKLSSALKNRVPDAVALGECLTLYSDFLYEIYYATMSALAAKHQIYIAAGSTIYFEDNELRHRAFLFDDSGSLAGFQDKLGLNKLEQALAIEEASEIKAFDTPVSTVSMLIGEDVEYFETVRISKKLGAKMIINPTYRMREYSPVDAASGLNLRVQESKVYGLQSVIVGDCGLGFALEGPGCIYAPNNLMRARNGILDKSSGRHEPDILYRNLDLSKLDLAADAYTRDVNPAFMDKYSDRLY